MRRGSNNDLMYMSDLTDKERDPNKRKKSGAFLGINLGADFCSEHEWGIKDIDWHLNRDKITHKIAGPVGEPENKKRWSNPGMIFAVSQDDEAAVLIFNDHWNNEYIQNLKAPMTASQLRELVGKHTSRELRLPSDGGNFLGTAWDDGSFGILVDGKDFVALLREIHEAFKTGDIAIWLGGGGVFRNAGLCIAIYSRLPKDVIQMWKDHYEDMQNLKAAAEATGIEEKLKKAGKKWFALSPKWAKNFKDVKSKYPVIYWLNPYDQNRINFGWFTVEDLEQWVEDKGPIPMTQEQMSERNSR